MSTAHVTDVVIQRRLVRIDTLVVESGGLLGQLRTVLTTEGEMGTLAEIGVAISILLADALTNDCVRFRNA